MGSQVRLSGLKIGVVDRVWIESKWKTIASLAPNKKPLVAPVESRLQVGCQPPPFSKARIKKLLQGQGNNEVKPETKIKVSFICVRMKTVESSLKHIRFADSVAMVKGKGLLGDSLIEISMGAKGKAVPASGFIRGVTPKGLSDLMSEGGEVVTKLKASLTRVEEILTQYSDPKLSSNLKGIIGSVNGIIGRVEKGPGLLHDLFYDKTLTRDVKRVVFQLQRLTANLASSVGQINRILAQARRRGTLVHSLLISRKSGRLAKQIRGLLYTTNQNMVALRDILRAPRKRGTLLYKVLHTKEAGKIVSDLTKASGNLRSIMDRINRGKGTLGAIINDPTAFEDFKTILGQVKRSRVFRTLIRFIIKRDDDVKGGRVVKP
jgi:phospholipid/cholesterol/gamma-HCH transport system substrate-binding protein